MYIVIVVFGSVLFDAVRFPWIFIVEPTGVLVVFVDIVKFGCISVPCSIFDNTSSTVCLRLR